MDSPRRILIVDDNATNVDILRRILRKEFELETAADGEACLAMISTFKPQLVLLDIMMPGIDGYETCQRIKSSDPGEFVQVILVSGKGTTADRLHGYEALADDYIVKPFDHRELLSKVRAHFRLRDLQSERQRRTVHESFTRLCTIVSQMSADICEHNHLIEEIQKEFSTPETTNPDALIHAVVRMANSNRATQGRLALSERKLREHAREIESHASDARTDALTLLSNRRGFDEELARRIAEVDRVGGSLSLAMIDIDHFKAVNDKYGHLSGDEVLRVLGRILGDTVRQMDMVARYGGDEFVAIMPATVLEDAKRSATRIRQAIEKSLVQMETQALRVTASMGLAQRLPGEDGSSLLHRADQSLYAAKNAGRNCVYWHDGKEPHRVTDDETSPFPQETGEHLNDSPFVTPLEARADTTTFSLTV